MYKMGIPEGQERDNETEEIFEAKMTESFPKLMSDIRLSPGSSENTEQDKCQRKIHTSISFLNYRKSKIK